MNPWARRAVIFTAVWLVTSCVRPWFWTRAENLDVYSGRHRITSLSTYEGQNGRVLILAGEHFLLSDEHRTYFEVPQTNPMWCTSSFCLGVREEALVLPVGVEWVNVELEGVGLRGERLPARIPAATLRH